MMPSFTNPQDEAVDLVHRLRNVLQHVEMDCECQASLSGALERFASLEKRRVSRRRLAHARDHKDRIAAILGLLSDLDEINEGESDRTVFKEIELLFAEIAACATEAADDLRKVQTEG